MGSQYKMFSSVISLHLSKSRRQGPLRILISYYGSPSEEIGLLAPLLTADLVISLNLLILYEASRRYMLTLSNDSEWYVLPDSGGFSWWQ